MPAAARPAEPPAPGEVEIRYLGAAGLYLHWGEDSILLGPFFSNPGLPRVLLGEWRADDAAIQHGLAGIDVPKVEAIFAGHSHYDHIGDLPVVLGMADRAQVFVNRTGVHALAPYAAGRSTRARGRPGLGLAHGERRREAADPFPRRPFRSRAAGGSLSLGRAMSWRMIGKSHGALIVSTT